VTQENARTPQPRHAWLFEPGSWTTLNQFINVAVAEKLSALRTVAYFKERAARADIGRALELLERAGDQPPREGDEIAPKLEEAR